MLKLLEVNLLRYRLHVGFLILQKWYQTFTFANVLQSNFVSNIELKLVYMTYMYYTLSTDFQFVSYVDIFVQVIWNYFTDVRALDTKVAVWLQGEVGQ